MRTLRRLLVGFGLLCLLVVATPGVASAHAQLESASPNQGSVLLEPPSQVVLHFGEPVEIDFGSLRVIGPSGKRVDSGGTHHPPGDTHAVAIALPAHLGDGTYVVAWRVISADSHPVHGAFVFSIGTAEGAAKANALATSIADQSGSAVVGVLYWLIRFAAFVGLLFLVGPAVLVALMWKEGGRSRRVGRVLWWSWGLLVTATVLGIAIQGIYASALPLIDIYRPTLITDVLHTRFGEVELLRLGLLAAFIPVLLGLQERLGSGGRRPWVAPAACVLGLGLLFTPGLAGHAATGTSPDVGLALDVVHLSAAAAWLGGLTLLATFLLAKSPGDGIPDDPLLVTLKVSALAFGAVMVVVATGVFQAIRQVGSIYALFNTDYGRTLVVKIGLVVVLIGVGGISRRLVHGGSLRGLFSRRRSQGIEAGTGGPQSTDGWSSAGRLDAAVPTVEAPAFPRRRLRRTVSIELAIAMAVLAVTSLLVNDVPAKQAAGLPFTGSFTTLGVQVNTIIDPARVGPVNEIHIYVLSSVGTPRAVPELDMSLSLPTQAIGPLSVHLTISGPGHYRSSGFDIPVAGTWIVKYTVRTDAIDEQVVTTPLVVH